MVIIKKEHFYKCTETHTHAGEEYKKGEIYYAVDDNTLYNHATGATDFGEHFYFKEEKVFKDGTWIVGVDFGVFVTTQFFIDRFDPRLCHLTYSKAYGTYRRDTVPVLSRFHKWKIKDSKPGDLLYNKTMRRIDLVKKVNGDIMTSSCTYDLDTDIVSYGDCCIEMRYDEDITPAEKWMRDAFERRISIDKKVIDPQSHIVVDLIKSLSDNKPSEACIGNFVRNVAHWQTVQHGYYSKIALHLQDIIPNFIVEWIVSDNGEVLFEGLESSIDEETGKTKYMPKSLKASEVDSKSLDEILVLLKRIDMFG